MRITITGGAGFIGSNLASLAIQQGHSVTVLDDFSTGYRENLVDLDLRLVEGSILNSENCLEAFDGAESVVHLAALGSVPRSILDPKHTHEVNATGTLNVLEAARSSNVGHVVVASSSSVYGANPALPKGEREWVRPMSPYAVSKLATEQYALSYQQSYNLDTLAFRFFNVFGPRQRAGHAYAAVIPIFVDALLRGQPLPINGDGTQSRDFTFVGTVCDVLLDACVRRVTSPEPVNLAYSTNTTLIELRNLLSSLTSTEPAVEYRSPRLGDVRHSQADSSRLMELFAHVEAVPLSEGLKQTIQWFVSTQSATNATARSAGLQ